MICPAWLKTCFAVKAFSEFQARAQALGQGDELLALRPIFLGAQFVLDQFQPKSKHLTHLHVFWCHGQEHTI